MKTQKHKSVLSLGAQNIFSPIDIDTNNLLLQENYFQFNSNYYQRP